MLIYDCRMINFLPDKPWGVRDKLLGTQQNVVQADELFGLVILIDDMKKYDRAISFIKKYVI